MSSDLGHSAVNDIPVVAKSMPPARCTQRASRERVMHLLDQARRHRFTFLNAPAGYGKTTVLADWCYRLLDAGESVVWFSADRRDRDPACFWLNFRYALGDALDMPLWEETEAADASREHSILTLANEMSLAARERGDLFVVFEGFDVLQGFDTLDELLVLMSAVSSSVHVVFSSRASYTKHSFPNHPIPDVVLSIGADALALTVDELGLELAAAGCQDAEELAGVLQDKTAGWPTAVYMVLDDIAAGKDPNTAVANLKGTDPRLQELFEFEVFSALDEDERDFLLRTSSFSLISSRIAGYTKACSEPELVLAKLLRHNAFIFPEAGVKDEYRLHPLFSQWLMERSLVLPPHEHRALNARAARWCLRNGYPVAAAKHKILSSEREDVFNLVRVAFPEMTARDLMEVTLFDGEPSAEELGPCFWLLAAWAYAYAAELEELAHWTRLLGAASQDNDGLRLSLAVLEVKALCLASRFDEGIARSHSIEGELTGKRFVPLRVVLMNCYAEALDQKGDVRGGMERHLEFSSLTADGSFMFLAAINKYEIAYSLMEQGDLGRAAQACRTIQAGMPLDYVVRGTAMSLGVLVDVLQGLDADLQTRLDEAAALISRTSNPDMYLDWCVASAWKLASESRLEEADAVLAEGCSLVKFSLRSIPRMSAVLPFQNKAMLSLFLGKADEAQAAYREFDQTGLAMTEHSVLVRRFVELAAADDAERKPLLLDLNERAAACGYGLLETLFGIEIALGCLARGQRTKAVRLLDGCIRTAQQNGIVAPFFWRPREMRPLLVVYLTAAKPDYANRRFAQMLLKSPKLQPRGDEAQGAIAGVELSDRERQVAKLACAGMARSEIAEELGVGESTVKSHLSHMYRKLGVRRYAEFLELASELGIS